MLASDKQVRQLVDTFKSGSKLTYKKGEYIIRPGEAPTSVYYIDQGIVKAFDITKYGEENLLIIRKAHEIFPIIWTLTGEERSIIYEAMSPSILWRISRKKYIDFLQNNPDALPPMLDIITDLYRLHSERILNLEYRTVRERLISFLIIMDGRFGSKTKEGHLIDVPLIHQDIASSINASRETTSRELSYLERKGLIKTKNSCVTITNLSKFKALL